MEQATVTAPQMIESSRTETKDVMKTPSQLVSGKPVQKRAELVQLSDFPILADQNFDREINSIPNARPTAIRIGLN